MGRRIRVLFLGIFVSFLLLPLGGCAVWRQAHHPAGPTTTVETRLPPVETIGLRLRREAQPAPPIMLPLTEADKAGVRTFATPGVGWIMLIEVNFFVSHPPREPADKEESAEVP